MFETLETKFYQFYFYLTDLKFEFQLLPPEKKTCIILNTILSSSTENSSDLLLVQINVRSEYQFEDYFI